MEGPLFRGDITLFTFWMETWQRRFMTGSYLESRLEEFNGVHTFVYSTVCVPGVGRHQDGFDTKAGVKEYGWIRRVVNGEQWETQLVARVSGG